MVDVKIKYLSNFNGEKLHFKHKGDSGFDLPAAVNDNINIEPMSCKIIPCGFKIELQEGYELQVRSRSGLALNNQIFTLNSPGTVDSSYRGEVKVILFNLSGMTFTIVPGMRIAQGVVMHVPTVVLTETGELNETSRNEGGFGSTGFK